MVPGRVHAAAWEVSPTALRDSLGPEPESVDSGPPEPVPIAGPAFDGDWLHTTGDDRLLSDPVDWRRRGGRLAELGPRFDYNRVDPLRLGLDYQIQDPRTRLPRLGARLEYATGRQVWLYGVQLEQPLATGAGTAVGVSMARATDHNRLQQVDDFENSLAFLLGRQDYRDYFEREGFGGYFSTRVLGLSTLSVELRNDRYRSLVARAGTPSWFHGGRDLRSNPPVVDGEARTAAVRLERAPHPTPRPRAGLGHELELETAGGHLGGDFRYRRGLADVRALVRTSPATTLALRLVGGSGMAGDLPPQREFVAGGPDGLRAHSVSAFHGNQLVLMKAEYTVELWHLHSGGFEGGLSAITFLDAGRAWNNPSHAWDIDAQRLAVDGGFGLGTAEDNLRVYFAKNLREPDSGFVISARLRRPF
jgi:hypothetical protein